jgi:hypothetical protein
MAMDDVRVSGLFIGNSSDSESNCLGAGCGIGRQAASSCSEGFKLDVAPSRSRLGMRKLKEFWDTFWQLRHDCAR